MDDILIFKVHAKKKSVMLAITQIYKLNTFSSRLLTLLPHQKKNHCSNTQKNNLGYEKIRYIKPETLSTCETNADKRPKNFRAGFYLVYHLKKIYAQIHADVSDSSRTSSTPS